MKYLKVGKILNTHGIKGMLKVQPLTDYNERFEELDWVYIQDHNEKFYLDKISYRPKDILLTFEGHNDINKVEKFKGKYILIDESQKRELPEDTHYISDLIGLDVYTVKDEYLGRVIDILQTGASDVYIIKDYKTNKEIMIPAVKEFIPTISLEEEKIIVDPIEGMIE